MTPLTIRASSTSAWPECNLRSAVHSFPSMFQEAGWDAGAGARRHRRHSWQWLSRRRRCRTA